MTAFPPLEVGVVFALAAEQGCFEDLLADVVLTETPAGKFRTGTLDGRRVTTVVSGPGRAAAVRGCEALCVAHRPRLVLSAGFCGALQPQLKRNDIVVADRIIALDGSSQPLDPAALGRFQLGTAHVGSLVEVDRIVAKSADKKSLGERTGGLACDMESAAVAAACVAQSTPMLAVRIVSDTADEDLPDDLESLMNAQPSPMQTLGAVVGTLWRRPGSIKDMLRLKETALVAADALAKYLATLVVQLPEERSASASRLTENSEP